MRAARATAQLLHRPAGSTPDDLVRRLLAVQGQDLRSARLSLRARSTGLTAGAVHAALSNDRSLVAGWLMRGTLHLVHRDDYGWLLGLTAPARVAQNARRLAQEGVAPSAAERAVALIERSLTNDGPLGRAELAQRLAEGGVRAEGQATAHLLFLAALRGVAVRGPVRGREQAYAPARDWLGAAPPTSLAGEARDRALAELARRYLAAHAPAGAADLAYWSGLPLRDARAGLAAAGDVRAPAPEPGALAPRLLPAFDGWMLGWKDRSFTVPPAYARRVLPGGGMLRATATADGCAVAAWRGGGDLDPFETLPEAVRAALEREAADVERFERDA